MAVSVSAAFSTMIVTISASLHDSHAHTLLRLSSHDGSHYRGATSGFTPFIIAVPVVTVAPVTTVPVITAMIAIANL